MKTVRVVVTRSHRHSMDRIVEVGEILDLPERAAIERTTTGAVKPLPPEPAPEAPADQAVTPAAGETGTEGDGVAAGEAPASSDPPAGPAAEPVADPELPIAPAEPPAAAAPVSDPEPQTTTPEPAAAEPAARARTNRK